MSVLMKTVEPSVAPARRFGEVVLVGWSLFVAGGEINISSSCRLDLGFREHSLHGSAAESDRRRFVSRERVENLRIAASTVSARSRRASVELQRDFECLWLAGGMFVHCRRFTISFVHYRRILMGKHFAEIASRDLRDASRPATGNDVTTSLSTLVQKFLVFLDHRDSSRAFAGFGEGLDHQKLIQKPNRKLQATLKSKVT